MALVSLVLSVVICISLPIILMTGWQKWARHAPQRGVPARFALAGFTFGSISAVFAVCSSIYASIRGEFGYYDPALITIYRIGFFLALAGLAFALGGLWKQNALRWYAPVLSICMVLLWCLWMSSE